jgi:hypothetical protein
MSVLELLVVCSIILILLGLIVAAAMRVIDQTKKGNTNRTIQKLNAVLGQHWDTVIAQAQVESIPTDVMALAGGDGPRARVIYVKLRLRQEFPTSFAEALNTTNPPSPLPALPSYAAALQGAPNAPLETQAAACLWLALKEQRGSGFNPDTGLTASELGALSPTLKYIKDGWGGPLYLSRWPVGSTDLNPAGAPQPGIHDALDPNGYLSHPTWCQMWGGNFAALCHPVAAGASWTLDRPVIGSPGPDGALGLDATMTVTNLQAARDNIYSYQLQIVR